MESGVTPREEFLKLQKGPFRFPVSRRRPLRPKSGDFQRFPKPFNKVHDLYYNTKVLKREELITNFTNKRKEITTNDALGAFTNRML
jgi:hypothetical protein